MANIEKLLADHAHWADERKRLKKAGQEAAYLCTSLQADGHFRSGNSCIDLVASEWRSGGNGYDSLEFTFEEVWSEMVDNGEVCQHCQDVRRLKRERAYAGMRLGAVRSAITKIGRAIHARQPSTTTQR